MHQHSLPEPIISGRNSALVTHAVAPPLQVSQLLEVFNTYPTLTQALTAIID